MGYFAYYAGGRRFDSCRRMKCAGADLGVERLDEDATLLRPVAVQRLDHILEGLTLHRFHGQVTERRPKSALV